MSPSVIDTVESRCILAILLPFGTRHLRPVIVAAVVRYGKRHHPKHRFDAWLVDAAFTASIAARLIAPVSTAAGNEYQLTFEGWVLAESFEQEERGH